MTRYYNILPAGRTDSESPRLYKILSLALFALVTLFVTSCEEDPTSIGSKLLPGSDFVLTRSIDTLSARSYTMYDDSIRSDNPSGSFLGQVYDPYFGTTNAGFVSQMRLMTEWDDQPFIIDSVKLVLHITEIKGVLDPGIVHTLTLSEISEEIFTNTPYYSNREVPLTGYKVANIPLPALRADTINDIDISLPVSFGEYLTRDTAKLFHNNKIPDFRSFFKGLYFQLDPGADPLLLSLSLSYQGSGYYNNYIILFMRDAAGEKKEFYFVFDAKNTNAAYNKISHDFTTAEPGKKIQHINNDMFMDTLSYIQYLNGVYTKIYLPGLVSLKNNPSFDNIAVNKARLTIPLHNDGGLYNISNAPSRLFLRYKTASGEKFIVPDYNIDQYHNFFDGRLDTIAGRYNFNIAGFVQKYLDDTSNEIKPELEVFEGGGTKNVILKANNSKSPVKFEFTFTKF